MKPIDLIIATANLTKAAALERIVAAASAASIRRVRPDVDESGASFADNARSKAEAASLIERGAHAIASDGGLVVPALGVNWDPLRTSRFAPDAAPADKARMLLELLAGTTGELRRGYWIESVAVARDGATIACWTERGPECDIAYSVPSDVGAFWVDALLRSRGLSPGHWELLERRFGERFGSRLPTQ